MQFAAQQCCIIFEKRCCAYRKIAVVTPGHIQVHKGFTRAYKRDVWVGGRGEGVYNQDAYRSK